MLKQQLLYEALASTHKTQAVVKSASQADQAITQAASFWQDKHVGNYPWHIVTVDITLLTNFVTVRSPKYTVQKGLGVLKSFTMENIPPLYNLLAIYSTDEFTEQWVHSWVEGIASNKGCRILEVVRKDPGPTIDLLQ